MKKRHHQQITGTREAVSRVRDEGRVVTRTTTPEQKIEAFRAICREKSFAIIDGVTVDLFSASHVVAVYDALNEANRVLYLTKGIAQMCTIAFRLCK